MSTGALLLILGTIFGLTTLGTQHAATKGQLGLQKEQLAFEGKKEKARGEAVTTAAKMQEAMTEKQWSRLSKAQREERGERREERFETGERASSDRQLAMVLAMLQKVSQEDRGVGSISRGIPSIPSLLR